VTLTAQTRAQTTAQTGAAAELRRGSSSVRVAVGPGAPITSFCVDGRDWCAAGVWTDYAPTAGACTLPSFVAGAPRSPLPEGGLLAAEEPAVDVRADGAEGRITTSWPASGYPLAWVRTITFDAEGALCTRYEVTNTQRARLPFVWGCRLTLPWSSSIAIDIPRGSRSRVAVAHGEGLSGAGAEFAWPGLRVGGRLSDLAQPARLDVRRAVLCYVELPRGRFVVRDGDALLEITGDEGVVTHAHLWVNNDADIPGAAPRRWWRPRPPNRALAVGPAVGAPGLLSDAVGAWRAARWVDAGETVRWTVRYRPVSTSTVSVHLRGPGPETA
jgi:hypothetical protein